MSTPTVVQSNLVPIAVSTDGITYKNIVCKKAWNFNGDIPTTTDESDCGVHIGLGANTWNFDFEALLNTTPDGATEVSAGGMLGYWNAQTLLYVKVLYPAITGTAFFIVGTAYLTNFKLTNSVGSLLTFTGTLTGSGSVDITV